MDAWLILGEIIVRSKLNEERSKKKDHWDDVMILAWVYIEVNTQKNEV